jgi:mRNA-degrading endonuclease YafQ of YafQ-DinJ toxin-antitoxin module
VRGDVAKSSVARSKTSYRVELDEELLDELRQWPKVDRKRVGEIIRQVQENFGRPHLHSGLGIRDLSPKGKRLGVYECRVGRPLRLIFTRGRSSLLYFHMIGTHDEVQKFLKSFL